MSGGAGVVGHEDHRRPVAARQLAEQREHLLARLGVEVAGGLVGEHQTRLADERTGDRDALLLAAGEPLGGMCGAAGEADLGERRAGALVRLGMGDAAQQ